MLAKNLSTPRGVRLPALSSTTIVGLAEHARSYRGICGGLRMHKARPNAGLFQVWFSRS